MNSISVGKEIGIITKRELKSFFVSPIAYIVIGIFLLVSGVIFFPSFFAVGLAEMRGLFAMFPLYLSFTIPAIAMRVFAEEKRSGTYEVMLTMPLRSGAIVGGKILAVFISSAAMVAVTIIYPLSIAPLGHFDFGPLAGGYLGTFLLALSFSAIGVFASSLTKNQIVAFMVALLINLFLSLLHYFLIFISSTAVDLFQYLSVDYHFSFISKGLIDSRSLIYFLSIAAIFYFLTVRIVEERR